MKKGRYLYWIIRDLTLRHTRSLIMGFGIGFLISMTFWHFWTDIQIALFPRKDKIGIIGMYSPTSLPLFIKQKISSGLVNLNEDGTTSPGLASWWEASESGKLFTFHLREDAVWHDGLPIEAKDINYNVKNVKFTITDPHTLKAVLDEPYSPFPVLMTRPLFRTGLVGFGDDKVSKIKLKGDQIQNLTLIAAQDAQDHKQIIYNFYQTEAQAIMAYKLGEIDEIIDISNPQTLVGWGNTKINEIVHYDRIITLFFNLKHHEMADKTLRQALGYAMPVFSQEKAISPIPKTNWAYTDKVRQYTSDKDEVKKLLANTNISTSSADLVISCFSQNLDTAQAIVNNWSSFGIQASIKVENSLPDDFQMFLASFDVPPDPDQYPFWHSTQTDTNITNYGNVKIDKLLEDGRQTMDDTERKKIYADFARRLVDDSPALFLYYQKTYSVKRGK